MGLKIFFLVFLMGLISQTISRRLHKRINPDLPRYIDIDRESFFKNAENELVKRVEIHLKTNSFSVYCVNRTIQSMRSLQTIDEINAKLESLISHVEDSRSYDEIKTEIESIFSQIAEKVKNNHGLKTRQQSIEIDDLENQLAEILLSSKNDDLELKVKLIADTSMKQMQPGNQKNNPLLLTVLGNLFDKIVLTTVLKSNPRYYSFITHKIKNLVRNHPYLESHHVIVISANVVVIKEMDGEVRRKDDSLMNDNADIAINNFIFWLNNLMTSELSSNRRPFLKCLLEETMMEYLRIDFYRKYSIAFTFDNSSVKSSEERRIA